MLSSSLAQSSAPPVFLTDSAVTPETDPAIVRQIPGRRRRTAPAAFRPIAPLPPFQAPSREVVPTPERRARGQEVVEETVTVREPVSRGSYDPVTRENTTEIVQPGEYARVHRIRGPLDTLVRSGDIGSAEEAAGRRYAREFELAGRGIRGLSIETNLGGTGGTPQGISEHQVECLTSLRRVREALGLCAEVKLRLLLVEELSFSAMAEKLDPKGEKPRLRRDLQAQSILLLEQLAEHYRGRSKRSCL